LKDLCQKYEDFLSLRFLKASVFINVFGPASEEPIFQCSSQNASLIDPSDILYPEWIENEMLTWVYQENGKLYLKGAQFNNYGDLSALVRLYIPFEFQNLDAFNDEYKLSIQLYKQPIPAQDARRVGKSGITMSSESLENILFQQKFPILVQQWESGEYLTAGMIAFSPFTYFSQMQTPTMYSAALYLIFYVSFFLAFVIIVFSSVLGYVINRNMRKAFDAIVDGAHHFSSGDFDHRISLTSKDEYSVIGGALNQMAIGIKRYTEDMIKKELMERELSIASEVQRRIFPQKAPELRGFDFGIVSKPYGKVGGDYYDFIEYPDGEVAVVVADASGKGMPAALMVASLNAILHSYEKPERLTDFLSVMNSRLWKIATENAYITLVYCLFHGNGEDIQYVNAGHPYPLLFNSNHEFTPLAEGGASLGMFDSIRLRDGKVRVESGDIIVFVTDGILEAVNASEEEFGTERLKEAIAESHLDPAQEIAGKIFAKLRDFSSSEKLADDATCIVIKKL
jgi:serine phosphatase RsbU (regulator of sigma subunit)